MSTKSIVLLSGGLDSAVALFWAIKRGYEVETMTFDYFHRTRKEIDACQRLADYVNCPNRRIQLDFLKEVEDARKTDLRNIRLGRAESAYIPCRNIIFYGIAASFAEITDSKYIVGGHNKDDASTFPDSSLKFFKLFNNTASLGRVTSAKTGNVILPFGKLEKSKVIKVGSRMHVPFELTWSCYKNWKEPCGRCHSCLLRAKAFLEAGVKDPLMD